MTISAVAEAAPGKIKTLVYLAAYLPKDGQSLLDLGNSDKESKIGPFLKIMKDEGIAVVDRSGRADLFCNLCPPQLRAAVPNLIVDDPLPPLVDREAHSYAQSTTKKEGPLDSSNPSDP